jgi:hypothetical protein
LVTRRASFEVAVFLTAIGNWDCNKRGFPS